MDFQFTDEQNALRDMVAKFAEKELKPYYAQWDKEKKYPRHLHKKMGEIGILGMTVPPDKGGLGASHVAEGIACEEASKGDCSITMCTQVAGHLVSVIMAEGNGTIQKEFLEPFLAGDKIPAFAITEPGAGTDAVAMTTRAVKKGASYILNGEKAGITAMMDADFALVFAKTDPNAGAKGVSCFVIPTDLPGVTLQSYEDMGVRAVKRGSMFMDDVEISEDYLVGKEGTGFKMGMQGFDVSRILLGLEAIAAAMVSLEETIEYAKQRNTFGRPLASFEGVSFPIVEHISLLEAVRLLCYKGLWLRDQGQSSTKVAGMVKWMAPRFSTNALRDCLTLHGHPGYTDEFPFEQRLRDVLAIEIADGTSQASKLVAMREIFGREYLPYSYRHK
jgi:cyclohexanecarboxyl-CoA dehydrogenase